MIVTTFRGQATIQTVFRSFGTDADARRIRKAIVGSIPLLSDEDNEVSVLALLLANTLSIEWDAQSEVVKSVKDYWDWVNTHFIVARDSDGFIQSISSDPGICSNVWLKYRRMVGNEIQHEWYSAFQKAQDIAPPSPEMAKEGDLPEELVNDPDFLAGEKKPEKDFETDVSIMS